MASDVDTVVNGNQSLEEPVSLPSIAALYSHSKDLSEKIVCDENTLVNYNRELEGILERTSILEGAMWLHVCNITDGSGKPLYSNDRQRQAAYESLVALCKTDSPKVPNTFKEYKELFETSVSVKKQIDLLKISVEAMRRVFTLNVAIIRSIGGSVL